MGVTNRTRAWPRRGRAELTAFIAWVIVFGALDAYLRWPWWVTIPFTLAGGIAIEALARFAASRFTKDRHHSVE